MSRRHRECQSVSADNRDLDHVTAADGRGWLVVT